MRFPRFRARRVPWTVVAGSMLLVAASVVGAIPNERVERIARGGTTATGRPSEGGPTTTRGAVDGRTRSPSVDAAACAAGRNGGATDTGVTARSITLGATVVETGLGRSFLGDVRYGMIAVVDRVNRSGGICGRRLHLSLKDDGWDPARGATYLRDLVERDRVFALAVVPSSEGLRAASSWLRAEGIPVVGTDGMLVHQHVDENIWPVAASTITAMHAIVKDAYDRGARRFAIVYDSNYHFGVEGAYAYNAAVRRVTGRDVPGYANPLSGSASCRSGSRFCGIRAGLPGYATEVHSLKDACSGNGGCDLVTMLLEPQTALQWMQDGGPTSAEVRFGVAAPQPLFNRSFASQCGRRCHDVRVWTGYVPPIEPFTSDAAVSRYLADVRRTNANADAANPFVIGGYVGMELLVRALELTGPTVTRARLAAVLDSMRFDPGLARPMRWGRGRHFANTCVMAFSIQSRPFFAGWRQERDALCDPWTGLDVPRARD